MSIRKRLPLRPNILLTAVQEPELKLFEENIARFESGALDSDDFRRFSPRKRHLRIRNTTDEHMVRIKIKWEISTRPVGRAGGRCRSLRNPPMRSRHHAPGHPDASHQASNVPTLPAQNCGLRAHHARGLRQHRSQRPACHYSVSHRKRLLTSVRMPRRWPTTSCATRSVKTCLANSDRPGRLPRPTRRASRSMTLGRSRKSARKRQRSARLCDLRRRRIGRTPNAAVLIEEFTRKIC